MRQFFIKTFHKRKAVKVVLFSIDKKYQTFYVIPSNDGNVTIDKKTFIINHSPVYDSKGFPTYFFKYNNTKPLNVNPEIASVTPSETSPDQYTTGIENNITQQLFSATDSVDKMSILVIIVAITFIVSAAGMYMLFNEISALKELLEPVNNGGGDMLP